MTVVDHAALPSGPGFLCFDSTPLMACAEVGLLDQLGAWFDPAFAPRVVIEHEVGDWVRKYPHNQLILDAPWLHSVAVDDADDIREVERIRHDYFGSAPDKDHGEAEVIVLCRRHGWIAALDDGEGRKHAARADVRVPSVMILTIIIAAAAEGLIAPKDAWQMHAAVDAARGGGRSFLTGQNAHRPAFMASIEAFRRIGAKRSPGPWPAILTLRGLDDVVRHVRQRTI